MPKMRGTGKDPLGRYSKGLIFDLEDNDPEMVQDFVDKGWAELLPEEEHPGRTRTQIAAAIVRGDALADPVEQKLAADVGRDAHAIVHLEDPDATASDYEEEAQKGPAQRQTEVANPIPADYHGGPVEYPRARAAGTRGGDRTGSGKEGSGGTSSSSSSGGSSSGGSSSGGSSGGTAEKQPGGAAKS